MALSLHCPPHRERRRSMTTKVELPSKDAYELTDALEVLRAAVEAEQEKLQRYQALVNQEEQLLRQRQNEAGAAERQAVARHQQLEADHQRKLQREKSTLEDDRKGLLEAEQNFTKRQQEASQLLSEAEALRQAKEDNFQERQLIQKLKAEATATLHGAQDARKQAEEELKRHLSLERQLSVRHKAIAKRETDTNTFHAQVAQREKVVQDQESNIQVLQRDLEPKLAELN